jgi:signal-transduction protein with cAMP-binding, CBS, and nucleotidyltransferase domain
MMRERRIRHVPVCEADGDLVGLISIGDLNAWHTRGQEVTIHHLHEYIHGRI